MPSYIVTCKENTTPEQIEEAKQRISELGGKIGHEYTHIKAFQATFDNDMRIPIIDSLSEKDPIENVEPDDGMSMQ